MRFSTVGAAKSANGIEPIEMNSFWQRLSGTALGAAAATIGERPPWRSKTVLAALLATLVGVGIWIAQGRATVDSSGAGGGFDFHRPLPAWVDFCASYVGGFFIGWGFRRFLKITAMVAAALVGLLALAKYVGMDGAPAEEHIKHGVTLANHGAESAKQFLTGLLPSTIAGGVGIFRGFRCR